MGIIQKQAIKGTLYTYLGVFLGFVNTTILFTRILTKEEIGLISILVAYSLILAQFGSLGFNSTTTRMFSYFRTKDNKHNGYLFLLVVVTAIGFILSLAAFYFFKPMLIAGKQNAEGGRLLIEYFYYIIPITLFTLFFNALDTYNKVLFNAVRGTFLKEFLSRLLILISIIMYSFDIIDFNSFVFAYVVAISSPAVIIMFLLIKDKQFCLKPDFGLLTKDMKKTLFSVSLFGIIAGASGIITLNIDRIMIGKMIGLEEVGVYATAFFFGTFIVLPSRALLKISSAVISESWKNNDLENLNIVYKKSTLIQLIIGSYLLIGIWGNIDNIIEIMTKNYEQGRYVILFIALAYLTDMASGVAGSILGNSHKYRLQAFFMLIMILLLILANFILIPMYQIVGAAIASFIAKFAFNLIRYFYIWYRFKLQPFDYRSLIVIGISLFTYGITYLLPQISTYYVDILIRGTAISIIFGCLIYFLKISDDINNSIAEYIKKISLLLGITAK